MAGYRHVPHTQPIRTALRGGVASVVPLADRAIGNLQLWLIGTHHGVSRAQLQVYLDEFVFRHNRRRSPMAAFQTLLGLGTSHPRRPLVACGVARISSSSASLNHNILGSAETTG
jgi:hypothetical protein